MRWSHTRPLPISRYALRLSSAQKKGSNSYSSLPMGLSASAGHELLSFINASPTPFHAVRAVKTELEKAGFQHLEEKEPWNSRCVPGGKYCLTRNTSTIVAFTLGKKWRPGNPIAMVGAHTDSPTLRLKPISKKESNGFIQGKSGLRSSGVSF